MKRKQVTLKRRGEEGQTIILVAVCVLSLLAMAALAVDVVTLYVAKGEIQHAADAAALAGAKAFVESGVTTDTSNVTLQTVAKQVACPDASCSSGYISDALKQNLVSGSPAAIDSSNPVAYDFTSHNGNPRITVTLKRINLPIFFARIWSNNLASVGAKASAEAYNSSWSQLNNGSSFWVPTALQCVKPIMVANNGPGINPKPLVDTASPFLPSPGLIGKELTLKFNSCGAGTACIPYLPQKATVGAVHNYCSSCAGASDYEQSIGCCDATLYDFTRCGDAAEITANIDLVDPSGPGGTTQNATQCLIHTSGVGSGSTGQDTLDISNLYSGIPLQVEAGTYSHNHLVDGSGVAIATGAPMTTSDSIVTLPIYSTPPSATTVTIVGFLQVFINYINPAAPAPGDLDVTILNIAGCGNLPGAIPSVSGGGAFTVPVRLVN